MCKICKELAVNLEKPCGQKISKCETVQPAPLCDEKILKTHPFLLFFIKSWHK
jgi:hypothetical protein